MNKIRIIPCLDVDKGRVVKGINFVNLKDAGDPVEQAKIYSQNGADEIMKKYSSNIPSQVKLNLPKLKKVNKSDAPKIKLPKLKRVG